MKTLFLIAALAISLVRAQATTLTLDGNLTYDVTEPRCSFKLTGKLKNNNAFGSGTLKLVLWATPNPFPSPGYIVGEYTLGAIGSRQQFNSFTVKTPSKVPAVTGKYNFTIVIAEYTSKGWVSVNKFPVDLRRLQVGNFVPQSKWVLPIKPVIPPVGSISAGNFFLLSTRSTDELNLFPAAFRDKTTITINSNKNLTTTLRTIEKPASYTYKVKDGKYNKKRVTYTSLVVDYGSKGKGVSTITYSFYFQDTFSGTFQAVEKNTAGTETTWGTFVLY